jgi:hypothetical protein
VDDAVTTTLGNWNSSTTIPDAQWQPALNVVTAIAQRYGFRAPQVLVSHPGAHEASLFDQYQAQLTVGLGHNIGFTFQTGCHLTAAAKLRGHPAPTPTY